MSKYQELEELEVYQVNRMRILAPKLNAYINSKKRQRASTK